MAGRLRLAAESDFIVFTLAQVYPLGPRVRMTKQAAYKRVRQALLNLRRYLTPRAAELTRGVCDAICGVTQSTERERLSFRVRLPAVCTQR